MPIIRLMAVLVLIAAIVLLAKYFQSQNSKYLLWLKKLAQYAGWFLLFTMILFLLSRVIRL